MKYLLIFLIFLISCTENDLPDEDITRCNSSIIEIFDGEDWLFDMDCVDYKCQGQDKP